MIDISTLTESDRGREVRYRCPNVVELGHIKAWNSRFIFVRYHTRIENGVASARIGHTNEATDPQDLDWSDA